MEVKVDVHDSAIRQIVPEEATMELIAAGFAFTEGPVWCGDYFLFTDIPRNRIVRWSMCSSGPEVTTFRSPSGRANGLTLDKSGRLIVCETGTRRVTRTEFDGSISVLAELYEGKRLNSPNDVIVRSDGSIYFTDPHFQKEKPYVGIELPFKGVYRIAPDGDIQLLVDDFGLPNGLVFSPDENVLYVNDSGMFKPGSIQPLEGNIRAFDVNRDGSVSNGRIFIEITGDEPGFPDGMKVDRQGNVYCTGPGGIWIMNTDGKYLGRIIMEEEPANFAWGDSDSRSLYITARGSIYRMRLAVPGIGAFQPMQLPGS
ncbi:SMP-30/gluconolactonase/LRE family protein [Chloroflexota bacterium]